MDVRDLNILDWVLWDNTPCQVTAIGCDYIETTKCGITLAESHLLNFIPLTDEILKKNGFVKDKTQYDEGFYEFWSEDLGRCIYLYVYKEYFLVFDNLNMEIKYVHELQHAMRLCGIEKEIEIWN